MHHVSFEPPTDHYDESIEDIDEQICQLVDERKQRSNNNPGFPPHKLISSWAKTYHFYEDFLNSLFSTMIFEDQHKPVVEPKGFIKNIPILKAHEEKDVFYSITMLRQYKNASVLYLNTDKQIPVEMLHHHELHDDHILELFIEGGEQTYDCQWRGGGSGDHMSTTYVISPPLPDEGTGLKLIFKEFKSFFKEHPTGFEFVIEYGKTKDASS
ncbi:hypothetical protein [Alkalicoccobacillus plakortidis]|uniref:Uncharacterized protein n=1 Tax=Alkalicoccobacillus plakortidis TaxID=444060 RepID=A0ABT0XNZ3_9BACI|nr:hypothetical protein [Alkalicoccobacillus plakortidis]MCM2677614.1 hypothetical protein [Alkalicoccobacillus plakortidis]